MTKSAWIAADWGTTHLRVWRMEGERVLDEARSAKGMGALTPDGFEPALLELIGPWIDGMDRVEVVACGMVGARQGWIEAPYAATPCRPGDPAHAVRAPVADPRLTVTVLPGLCQHDPADVMRGEETQIAGLLQDRPEFDGMICLPGTHTKWVRLRAGLVEGFSTFMTGEVFALLAGSSVLRHSVPAEGWDDAAFSRAFRETFENPAALAPSLFPIRAEGLLRDVPPGAARARLSGLLLGAEFAAVGDLSRHPSLAILGSAATAKVYRAAFSALGHDPLMVEAQNATLGGLCAARALMEQQT